MLVFFCLVNFFFFFFFKQKTAYEMRISDWSSDVCSSDLDLWRISRPSASPWRSPPSIGPTRYWLEASMSRVAGQASTGVDSAPDGVEVEGRRLVEVVDPVGVAQVRVAAPGVHRRPRGIVLRIVVLLQGAARAAFEVPPVLPVPRCRLIFQVV